METIFNDNKHKVINCMQYLKLFFKIYYLENMILLSILYID